MFLFLMCTLKCFWEPQIKQCIKILLGALFDNTQEIATGGTFYSPLFIPMFTEV